MFCAILKAIGQKNDEEWAKGCLKTCLEAATSFVDDENNNKYTRELHSGLAQ